MSTSPDLDGADDQTLVPPIRQRPSNLAAVSVASFFTDISSEMLLPLLPLYLATGLGVRANVIGLIEGVAESLASLLKLVSGWLSDRLGARKSLAVAGYSLSAASKPFLLLATTWWGVAAVRWSDRLGKGLRTAPRDALLADSVEPSRRGWAFGLHRAADTAGAVLGLGIALTVIVVAGGGSRLETATFRKLVLVSIAPALLAVVVLWRWARDVPVAGRRGLPQLGWRALGPRFGGFLLISAVFDLGNSADAFLVLRASERGSSIAAVLVMLLGSSVLYAATSTWAGRLADRLGKAPVLIAGWALYAAVYLGLALADRAWQVWTLGVVYGLYYGLTHATAKALIADLVEPGQRGMAFGTYAATLGVLDLPASVIAGVLWHGVGGWRGWGPGAPFLFGAGLAAVAALLLGRWAASGDAGWSPRLADS